MKAYGKEIILSRDRTSVGFIFVENLILIIVVTIHNDYRTWNLLVRWWVTLLQQDPGTSG